MRLNCWLTLRGLCLSVPLSSRALMVPGSMTRRRLSRATLQPGTCGLLRFGRSPKRLTLTIGDDEGRPMWVIQKERRRSPKKIDACMAAILAWLARVDAIKAGQGRKHYAYTA